MSEKVVKTKEEIDEENEEEKIKRERNSKRLQRKKTKGPNLALRRVIIPPRNRKIIYNQIEINSKKGENNINKINDSNYRTSSPIVIERKNMTPIYSSRGQQTNNSTKNGKQYVDKKTNITNNIKTIYSYNFKDKTSSSNSNNISTTEKNLYEDLLSEDTKNTEYSPNKYNRNEKEINNKNNEIKGKSIITPRFNNNSMFEGGNENKKEEKEINKDEKIKNIEEKQEMSENTEDFNYRIIEAVEQKTQWFDSTELPKLQEDYRLHLTCVRNLFDALIKRSLINEDPYKKDKKISSIVPPESGEFNDNERALTLGIRLSDYESMLDFICNYMKFSVEQLSMDKIKKLIPACLVCCFIYFVTFKSTQALNEINEGLKNLADFQRERYKIEVRKNILMNPHFNKAQAYDSAGTIITEIKRLFPTCMDKKPLAMDLIGEIAAEEAGADKANRQAALLQKLQVEVKKSKKQENTVDTHEILMDALRTLGTTSEQYDLVLNKIMNNHEVLQSEHNSFMDKIKQLFRKMFGLAEPAVDYDVTLVDSKTGAKRKEKIHFTEFATSLSKRIKYYGSFSMKGSPGANRLGSQDDKTNLDFLNRQMIDNNHLMALLGALDEYFKNTATPQDRGKIKGIKMELTSIKNIIVKTNQIRAEYVAYIEEAEQLKRLGIVDNA